MTSLRWLAVLAIAALPFTAATAAPKKDVQQKFADRLNLDGDMPFQRALKGKIEERHGHEPDPKKVEFGGFTVEMPDDDNVDGWRKAKDCPVEDQQPDAPWKCKTKGRIVKVVSTTHVEFEGPGQAHGHDKDTWPTLRLRKQEPVGDKGDWKPKGDKDDDQSYEYGPEGAGKTYEELYKEGAQRELGGQSCDDPEHPPVWKGICGAGEDDPDDPGLYAFGKEPREADIEEGITFTFREPEQAEAFMRALAAAPADATLGDVVMGFTYLGPNIDYTIGDKRSFCISFFGLGKKCFTIYDIRAGFALDFAVGMRLPAQASLQPLDSVGSLIAGNTYRYSSQFTPADWDGQKYGDNGVASEEGNEFVLRMDFFAGAKVIILGFNACPWCQYVELDGNWSNSFATPFGVPFGITKFEVPLKSFDFGIVSLDLGVVITPTINSDKIEAGVLPRGAATGGNPPRLVYTPQQSLQQFALNACIPPSGAGDRHEATVAVGDFRYWFESFTIDLAASLNLQVFGYGAWNPTVPIVNLPVTSITGNLSLGPHVQCNWAFDCNPAGPSSVSVPAWVSDDDPPTTAISLVGTQGTNDWFQSPVDVTLAPADNPPGCGIGVQQTDYATQGGPLAPYAAPFTVPSEGVTTVSYRSLDQDKNTEETKTREVKVDWTAPGITGAATTSPNERHWYRTDVVVHFEATDATSGVASVTGDQTLSSDGADQSVEGIAFDKAGNSAKTTVFDIDIDKTPATITILSPQATTYQNTDPFAATWEARDALSGILSQGATMDGGEVPPSLILTPGGQHVVVVSAVDNADNPSSAEVKFGVDISIDGLLATLDYICGQTDWITKTGTCHSLRQKVTEAQASMAASAWTDARGQLGAFVNELEAQLFKSIVNVSAYDILRSDAEYVIATHIQDNI